MRTFWIGFALVVGALAFTIYGICAGWSFGFIFLTPFIGYALIAGAYYMREGLKSRS